MKAKKGFSKNFLLMFGLTLTMILSSSCNWNLIERFKERAGEIEQYEKTSLVLAKENRELKTELGKNQYDIQTLKARIQFLELQLSRKKCGDGGSSSSGEGNGDTVKFDIYQWSPDELLTMAQKTFNNQKFSDASNYFDAYLTKYPDHKNINDQIYFEAGVSSYKSQKFYIRAIKYLDILIQKYPASPYFRGAKLWTALSHYQKGNHKFFYDTVEEFRRKYRNTSEWSILSAYYEKFKHETTNEKH